MQRVRRAGQGRGRLPKWLSEQRGFVINDVICRRYPGAFRHPLDPALLALPWWLKEAILVLAVREG